VYYGNVIGTLSGRVLYSGPSSMECVGCQVSDQDSRLGKCPICFKWVCDNCAVRTFGRAFCSKKCADQFFFGDDDE
jgi:hypothetical protein